MKTKNRKKKRIVRKKPNLTRVFFRFIFISGIILFGISGIFGLQNAIHKKKVLSAQSFQKIKVNLNNHAELDKNP